MPHYYSEKQDSAFVPEKIKAVINGNETLLYTASGVFSRKKADKGTLLLAQNIVVADNPRVLDMGCGIGLLGVYIARQYGADVVMADVNERALALAKMNARLNNVKCDVVKSNLYENIKGKFDVIVTNPPQSAGKHVCFEIIEKGYGFLNEDGTLQLVARHNKGGRELESKMNEVFGNSEVIAKKGGYRVYLSTKPRQRLRE